MKNYISLFISALLAFHASAQDANEPFILPEAFTQKINPNGQAVMAQDISGSAIVYHIDTNEAEWYGGFYPGNGNCLSNNGILVGQEMEASRAAIMKDGVATLPSVLPSVLQSSFDAITPDGTRACGWVQNPRSGPMQIPFYCEIGEDGTAGEPVVLPYPSKDFFNDIPQFCTASAISDDGKTIAGIVQDATGFYSYPIIYKQNEEGKWEDIYPSEPLFNPEHLEIPKFPDLDNLDYPQQPLITDYMTPEMKKEWDEAMREYEASGDVELNPWLYVSYFTGEEGYEEYERAVMAYNQEVNNIIGEVMDDFWKQMAKVGEYARFIPNLALSPQGDTLIIDLGLSDDEFTSDTSTGYVTYKFDLSDNSYKVIESQYKDLIPIQILNDGTYIAMVSPMEVMGYNSYILLPGAADYIPFVEYIAQTNPSYLSWINDNLNIFGEGVISGVISFSEDKSVIAGGLPYGEMMSYIYTAANASVKGIEKPMSEVYDIFNLNGIKVLTTKEKSEISNLPKGIYIINGKKIKL